MALNRGIVDEHFDWTVARVFFLKPREILERGRKTRYTSLRASDLDV